MRHEVIHPMNCACVRCHDAAPTAFVDRLTGPDEVSAMQKGAVAAMWVAGVLAAGKYAPSIIEWMTAR